MRHASYSGDPITAEYFGHLSACRDGTGARSPRFIFISTANTVGFSNLVRPVAAPYLCDCILAKRRHTGGYKANKWLSETLLVRCAAISSLRAVHRPISVIAVGMPETDWIGDSFRFGQKLSTVSCLKDRVDGVFDLGGSGRYCILYGQARTRWFIKCLLLVVFRLCTTVVRIMCFHKTCQRISGSGGTWWSRSPSNAIDWLHEAQKRGTDEAICNSLDGWWTTGAPIQLPAIGRK
ncbi:hypothetical protein F4778DRAFT_87410 [Xylariomycetidae sp. FL2044]|nr:hypothetical protein F4778DRAFT_87410 [Xylariomycetidae sp. FL2044]